MREPPKGECLAFKMGWYRGEAQQLEARLARVEKLCQELLVQAPPDDPPYRSTPTGMEAYARGRQETWEHFEGILKRIEEACRG